MSITCGYTKNLTDPNDPLNFTDPLGLSRLDDRGFWLRDAQTVECDNMFRDEMGREVVAEIGSVDCNELVEALISGCHLRGGNQYTFDYDASWRTGCVSVTFTCNWRCDVSNAAGGVLQANPMYWVADATDGLFDVELDLAANQGVNPTSGWFRIGFTTALIVNIAAAPGGAAAVTTLSSSGAARLGAGCGLGAGTAAFVDEQMLPDIDQRIDPWKHAGAECLVGATVFFVAGRPR